MPSYRQVCHQQCLSQWPCQFKWRAYILWFTRNSGVYPLCIVAVSAIHYTFIGLWHVYFFSARCRQQLRVKRISTCHHLSFCTDEEHTITVISKCFVRAKLSRPFRLYTTVHPVYGYIPLRFFS